MSNYKASQAPRLGNPMEMRAAVEKNWELSDAINLKLKLSMTDKLVI